MLRPSGFDLRAEMHMRQCNEGYYGCTCPLALELRKEMDAMFENRNARKAQRTSQKDAWARLEHLTKQEHFFGPGCGCVPSCPALKGGECDSACGASKRNEEIRKLISTLKVTN